MMRYHEIVEGHHVYDDPDFNTEFSPVKAGDTFRVFHGFREFTEALSVAVRGTSGKLRVPRVYSYESDNNPKGIFVSLSRKVAAEFIGAYDVQAIVEFDARFDELEAPVWPGGSYTVQGGYSQYFGHGAPGRVARRQRQQDAEKETEEMVARDPAALSHIGQSDKRYLAYMLTNSREYQALFVGDLSPRRIAAWHVRPRDARSDDAWERISNDEFLKRYGDRHQDRSDRMFLPDEKFDGDEFIARMTKRFSRTGNEEHIVSFMKNAWAEVMKSDNKTRSFMGYFEQYLWPSQYVDALKWLRAEFGRKRNGDEMTD